MGQPNTEGKNLKF